MFMQVITWLDANSLADKEEFEHKKKELEGVCNPIITKLYQAAGGAGGELTEVFFRLLHSDQLFFHKCD